MVGLEGIQPTRSTELDTRLREVKAWPKVTQLVAAQPAQSTVLLTPVGRRPPHLSLRRPMPLTIGMSLVGLVMS